MKSRAENAAKEVYKQLRGKTCGELWEEVARFNRANERERMERVGLVRAVGVVFSESGADAEKAEAKRWLLGLLSDPGEKIRRYAMAALPKLGSGVGEEEALLSLLQKTTGEREKDFLGKALDKIGGQATLEAISLLPHAEQKVRANIARSQSPGALRMNAKLSGCAGLRIHLRGRSGLEGFVREEVEQHAPGKRGGFRVLEVRSGLVAITPAAPFSVADLYAFRCFGSVGFVLGRLKPEGQEGGKQHGKYGCIQELAELIASALALQCMETFTDGPLRYRLNFVEKGLSRGELRILADRVYALCPAMLNDARGALWSIDVPSMARGGFVELRPRLVPDPRLAYRLQDIPAASHPPLAACMARLAGKMEREIVWDPFCGSGLELIERSLLGGVRSVFGTDLSERAIAITEMNFAAAKLESIATSFTCCDFRDFERVKGLGVNSVSLVISNPPMGKRVPIPNLRGLISDLFAVSSKVLKPGGRLVFANPLRLDSPDPSLRLQSRTVVDFGGFDCWLELYRKR